MTTNRLKVGASETALEAERFLAAVSRDKFDYTEWRKTGLPDMSLDEIAVAANRLADQLDRNDELPH